jgi:hypothetical protein
VDKIGETRLVGLSLAGSDIVEVWLSDGQIYQYSRDSGLSRRVAKAGQGVLEGDGFALDRDIDGQLSHALRFNGQLWHARDGQGNWLEIPPGLCLQYKDVVISQGKPTYRLRNDGKVASFSGDRIYPASICLILGRQLATGILFVASV